MALTPEQLAAPGTEHSLQVAFFAWAALQHDPRLKWLHAIPSGGERNAIVAGRMKAEGVRKGVWDVCLPVAMGGYNGLYIEFKRAEHRTHQRGGLTVEQVEFGKFVLAQGYRAEPVYGWAQAARVVCDYLAITSATTLP